MYQLCHWPITSAVIDSFIHSELSAIKLCFVLNWSVIYIQFWLVGPLLFTSWRLIDAATNYKDGVTY